MANVDRESRDVELLAEGERRRVGGVLDEEAVGLVRATMATVGRTSRSRSRKRARRRVRISWTSAATGRR